MLSKTNYRALIVLMLLVLSLSACSTGEKVIVERYDQEETTSEIQNEARDYTITWTTYQVAPSSNDAFLYQMIGEEFNVNLDVWDIEEIKFDEMMEMRIAEGEVPDVFRIRIPSSLTQYAQQGILAEIDDVTLQTYAPNIYNLLSNNAPEYMDYGWVDGQRYGIPLINKRNQIHKPLVYRADWMEALGVTETPRTLEEFEALMYRFALEDPDGNGIKDTYGLSYSGLVAPEGSYGLVVSVDGNRRDAYFLEEDGQLLFGATHPYMKELLAKYHQWYVDGVLDPGFFMGENEGGYWAISHAFISGEIGFTSHGNYYHWESDGDYDVSDGEGNLIAVTAGAATKALIESNPDSKVIYGEPLIGPYGDQGIMSYNQLMNFVAFGKFADEEPGKLIRILEILDTISANPDPTVRATYSAGIEGIHWEWIDMDHDLSVAIPPYDDSIGSFNDNAIGAKLKVAMPFEPKTYSAKWAISNGWNEHGIESAIQVGVPAISEYGDTLLKIREEAFISIIVGDQPIDYFDEFVQNYNAAGGDQVNQEVNAWYQENVLKE